MAARGARGRRTDLTQTDSMSLISFHRFLIATAIAFCFGFAVWELMTWWVGRSQGALVLGVTFVALGLLLVVYLARLRRILGMDEEADAPAAPGPRR